MSLGYDQHDLRTARHRQPRSAERDDARGWHRRSDVDRRLHPAHGDAPATASSGTTARTSPPTTSPSRSTCSRTPRPRPDRARAQRRHGGRRQRRRSSFSELDVRQAGQGAAHQHRSRAPLEGRRRPDRRTRSRTRVGTGPYTLDELQLAERRAQGAHDYWGGELAGPTLYYVSYNDNTALTTGAANGDADWAQGFIPTRDELLSTRTPSTTATGAPTGLSLDMMLVNTTTKPFNDVALRQAVNLVVDRTAHAEIAREGGVPELTRSPASRQPDGRRVHRSRVHGRDLHGRRRRRQEDPHGRRLHLEGRRRSSTRTARPVTVHAAGPAGLERLRHRHPADRRRRSRTIGIDAKVDHAGRRHLVRTTWGPATSRRSCTGPSTGSNAVRHIYADVMDGAYLERPSAARSARTTSAATTTRRRPRARPTTRTRRMTRPARQPSTSIQKIFVDDVPAIPIGTRPFSSASSTPATTSAGRSEDDPYALPTRRSRRPC